MPLFEYHCAKCGTNFETLVRTATDTPGRCPSCGSKRIEKQLSTFAAAVNSAASAVPCASGACPAPAMAGGGCTTGCCPLN